MLFSWKPAVLSKCKYVSYHNLLKGQSQKQSLLQYWLIVHQSIVRDYCLLLYENLLGRRNSLTTCQLYESRDTQEFVKHQLTTTNLKNDHFQQVTILQIKSLQRGGL